jgi:hypothetical protein
MALTLRGARIMPFPLPRPEIISNTQRFRYLHDNISTRPELLFRFSDYCSIASRGTLWRGCYLDHEGDIHDK